MLFLYLSIEEPTTINIHRVSIQTYGGSMMRINHVLEQVIQRTFNFFPWYKSLISTTYQDLTKEHHLKDLPLLTSDVMEEHYYIRDHPFELISHLHRYQTSGTSRKHRKNIYYSEHDEEQYIRIKAEVLEVIMKGYQARRVLIDMGTGHAAATAEAIFHQLGLDVETVSFQLPINQHLARLSTFKPDVLYTMPSILDRILMASDDPLMYGIRKVILVGEVASLTWQQRVAERLGLDINDITDTYGSIEIGTIARYDHEFDRYLFVDGIIAEGLTLQEIGIYEDELEADERVLVLTSTVREFFPSIRFVTYDVVRDFESVMVDGQWRQSFRNIVRRIGNELKHGEKISIYDIEDVVYQHVKDVGIRVIASDNLLTVEIILKSELELLDPLVLKTIQLDISYRIPEIGTMIQNGLLQEIRVSQSVFNDVEHRNAVKFKKIHTSKEDL